MSDRFNTSSNVCMRENWTLVVERCAKGWPGRVGVLRCAFSSFEVKSNMDNSEVLHLNLVLDLVSFFNIFRGDMERIIDEHAQNLAQACRDYPDVEVIHSGSGFEGLSLPQLVHGQTWNTDADHMIIKTSPKLQEGVKRKETEGEKSIEEDEHVAHEKGSLSDKGSNIAENDLFIYDASHAGYLHLSNKRLIFPTDSDSVREHCLQNSKFIESSREFIPLSLPWMTSKEGSIVGPSYSLQYATGSYNVDHDFVYGLKCEKWPLQATEWILRDRPQSWPSFEQVSAISSQGCHVVPVGSHMSHLKEFEWRFSFSVAELMLARSLTDEQKLAYSVLKVLIKSEMKLRDADAFASYYLKTCLFWLLEKKGVKVWNEQSLATNVLELLDFLIAFYAKGSVPNYFIAKNNMVDHRSPEDILKTCHALREIRDSVTQSFCHYVQSNQVLPVLFDTSLTQLLKENPTKFLQNCKYNFLVMALAYILRPVKKVQINISSRCLESAACLVKKAEILHRATREAGSQGYTRLLSALSDTFTPVENPTTNMVLSMLEEYLATDEIKVTEASAVALAVFNVFLALHPSPLHKESWDNSLEFHEYLVNPIFKDCLFWAAQVHERYCDAIYNFVVKKWVGGPNFFTTDHEATKFMKLLMVILGKPTKQASAVTGSLFRSSNEGQMFFLTRLLADYLMHVHLECAYVTFQASAFLMNKSVLSEIYLSIDWAAYKPSQLLAIELVLSKQELQAELSEEDFTKLIEKQHELKTELSIG